MSSLDKLAIRGIRSFDADEMSTITFYSPVTLIIGANGSGKTTIIECLKYATTGELPPNAKGGAFVHDPSMAGRQDVKAQIKLRFKNTQQEMMLVERRLMVTKRKGTASGLTSKTLENNLSYVQTGSGNQRLSVSTRCLSLDTEMPRLLGVSKAILDNVIFCHQEESNWPLAESSVLKKKFDDIFESSKYTKAVDQLKDIRKNHGVSLRLESQALESLAIDKERARKIRDEILRFESQIAENEEKLVHLKPELERVTAENIEYTNSAQFFRELESKAEALHSKLSFVTSEAQRMNSRMDPIDADFHALKRRKQSFQADLQHAKSQRKDLELLRAEKDKATAHLESSRNTAQTALGALRSARDQYDAKLEDLSAMLQSLRDFLTVDEVDEDEDIFESATQLRSLLVSRIDASDAELKTLQKEQRAQLSALTNKVEKARAEKDDRASKVSDLREQLSAARKRETDTFSHLAAPTFVSLDSDINELTSRIAQLKNDKASLEAQNSSRSSDDHIQNISLAIERLVRDQEALEKKLSNSTKSASETAKVDVLISSRRAKQDKLDKLIENFSKLSTEFPSVTAASPPDDARVAEILSEQQHTYNDATKTSQLHKVRIATIHAEVASLTKDINANEASLRECESGIAAALSSSGNPNVQFDQALASAESTLEKLNSYIVGSDRQTMFYDRVLTTGQSQHKCVGCNRPLADHEIPDFCKYVVSIRDRQPKVLEQKKAQAHATALALSALRSAQPLLIKRDSLVEAVSISKDKLLHLKREHAQEEALLSKTESHVASLKMRLSELETLKNISLQISAIVSEIESIDRDLKNSQFISSLSNDSSVETVDEMTSALENIRKEIASHQAQLTHANRDRSSIVSRLHATEQNLTLCEMDMVKKSQLLKDRETFHSDLTLTRKAITELDASLGKLLSENSDETEYRVLSSELSQMEEDHNIVLQYQQDALYNLKSQLADFDAAYRALEQARNSCSEQDIHRGHTSLLEAQNELSAHQETLSSIDKQIQAVNDRILSAGRDEKNLDDNIEYHRLVDEEARLRREYEQLDLETPSKSRNEFVKKCAAMTERKSVIESNLGSITATIQSARNSIAAKERDLEMEYSNIDQRYTELLVKVKTSEAAVLDLEKYQKALERSMVEFHAQKMAEINNTLHELWGKVYKGQDVDCIRIVADAEGPGQRSQNYKMVMVKDQTELDMRGRCSAGQKVLASILTRLALADSFSVNCGILALDEPTTNLDHANIIALAESLAALISERSTTSNFQLIVITHDEAFVEIFNSMGVLDRYWKLDRTNGGLLSKIIKMKA